jgi:hypothetical protein
LALSGVLPKTGFLASGRKNALASFYPNWNEESCRRLVAVSGLWGVGRIAGGYHDRGYTGNVGQPVEQADIHAAYPLLFAEYAGSLAPCDFGRFDWGFVRGDIRDAGVPGL